MKPYYSVSLHHYYGNIVRKLFLAAALVMLATLPFFYTRLPVPLSWSLLVIVVIGFLAGVTNPVSRWPVMLNTLISAAALILFEYHAINFYQNTGPDTLFWINQGLAILFLIALYYSTKTIRAMMMDQK